MLFHHMKYKIGWLSGLEITKVTGELNLQVNGIHMCLQLVFLFPRETTPFNWTIVSNPFVFTTNMKIQCSSTFLGDIAYVTYKLFMSFPNFSFSLWAFFGCGLIFMIWFPVFINCFFCCRIKITIGAYQNGVTVLQTSVCFKLTALTFESVVTLITKVSLFRMLVLYVLCQNELMCKIFPTFLTDMSYSSVFRLHVVFQGVLYMGSVVALVTNKRMLWMISQHVRL